MSLPTIIVILTKFAKYGAKTGTRYVDCNDKIHKFRNGNYRFTSSYSCSDAVKTCVSSGTRIVDGFSVLASR